MFRCLALPACRYFPRCRWGRRHPWGLHQSHHHVQRQLYLSKKILFDLKSHPSIYPTFTEAVLSVKQISVSITDLRAHVTRWHLLSHSQIKLFTFGEAFQNRWICWSVVKGPSLGVIMIFVTVTAADSTGLVIVPDNPRGLVKNKAGELVSKYCC